MKHLLPFYILFISFLFANQFVKAQTIITQWNFNSSFSAISANGACPAPSIGTGSINLIGNATATQAAGAPADPGGPPNNAINTSSYPTQGTADFTAGIDITGTSLGYKDIIISYEQQNSGSAANRCELEFQSSVSPFWSTIAGVTDYITVSSGGFINHSFNLSGQTYMNNSATIRFRIKTRFAPVSTAYAPTTSATYATTGTIRYDLITIKGTPLACAGIPTQQATNIVFAQSNHSTNQFIVNRGNGTHLLILAKAGSPVDANPVDGANYAASRSFGFGSEIGTGNYVVYNNNPQTNSSMMSVFNLTAGVEYHYAVYEYNGVGSSPCYLAPPLRASWICNSTLLTPGDLLFMGYDEDVEAGGQDGIWLTNLEEIRLGTTFSLINSRYEMGATPSNRTHQWFAGGNNPNAALAQIKIKYNGAVPIPKGSVIHFQIDGSGVAGSFDVNNSGVTTFSATSNSNTSLLSATANQEQDQLFLVQGDLTQYGIVNTSAYSLLSGRVIHALSRQNDWVAFSATPSAGGLITDRFSRKPPQIEKFPLYFSGSNNGAAYYNGLRTGDKRIVIGNISNMSNWVKLSGISGVNDIPNSIFNIFTQLNTGTPNYYWVGFASTDWFDADNWFGYSVPDSLAEVSINDYNTPPPNFPIINLTSTEPATRHQNKAASKYLLLGSSTPGYILTLDGNGNDSLTVFDYFSCSSVLPILNLSIGGNNTIKFRGVTYYATNNIVYGPNSHTIFEGAYNQFINTNDPGGTFFNEITINNPDSVSVQQRDMHIDKQLNLKLGRLTSLFSTTNVINIKSSTVITSPTNAYGIANEGWEKSFVATRMSITNTANGVDKVLPIGKGLVYAPIRLNKSNANTCKYTAEYFDYTPIDIFNITPNLDHVSQVEFWNISASDFFVSINDTYAQVALSWRPSSFVNTIPVGNWQDSICVAHYYNPGAGNSWLMERDPPNPPDVVTGNTNYGWVKTNRSFGNFAFPNLTLGSLSKYITLPVKLLSFNANKQSNFIQTNWQVVDEKNVLQYEVEKSVDGIHFTKLGSSNASNVDAWHSYQMLDANPTIGWNYYRLKIVSSTNEVSYSKIVRVQFGKNNNIVISPSPATEFLQVQNASIGAQLQLLSTDGKILHTKLVQSTNEKINVQALSAGVYFIKVVSANETFTQSFMKQ
jgi:hypothetical protein